MAHNGLRSAWSARFWADAMRAKVAGATAVTERGHGETGDAAHLKGACLCSTPAVHLRRKSPRSAQLDLQGWSGIWVVCPCLHQGLPVASASAEQLRREKRQEIEAQQGAQAQHLQLRSAGRETATPYGAAMLRASGEAVREALEMLFAKWALRPGMAGPHYCALPLLLHLGKGAPAVLVTVLLQVVCDKISETRGHRQLCNQIGKAVELEVRGSGLKEAREGTLRLMKGRYSRQQITAPSMLQTMGLQVSAWSQVDRFEVGALLLDLVVGSTALCQLVTTYRNGRRHVIVRPTEEALAIAKACPPRPRQVKRQPMVVPPRPWAGLEGGGHLGNRRPLVIRAPHLKDSDLALQLAVVNQLQRQELKVNPWMVAIQRQAWEHDIPGLFPVRREPLELQPRPTERVGKEAMRRWHRARLEAEEDRRKNLPLRVRIRRSLTAMEELTGGPCWFAYELDWRGRIYTAQREVTHQGPDWEKAAIELPGKPAGEQGFEWLLRAAAGHWGIRGSWDERLRWGTENLPLLAGAAEAPLERLDQWRDAADPWQFLQLCRGVRSWLQDPAEPIGCPVRLDQHASGIAILAGLTRDGALAAATRLTGDNPVDLYGLMAERTVRALRRDLEAGPQHLQQLAAGWLELGVNRTLLKGPTMTSVYGAGYWSCADGLMRHLEDRKPGLAPALYERELVRPAQYLAGVIGGVLKEELVSCQRVRAWLREVSYLVVRTQQEVRWTSPTGMLVELGREAEQRRLVPTAVSGSRRWAATRATPGELSALATARGITANLIHSFDGAFCQRIVSTAGEQGIELLTNHDCFGAVPANAAALHRMLHEELARLYRPNWLPMVAQEIQARSGVTIPPPPLVGKLRVGEIGTNHYAFC